MALSPPDLHLKYQIRCEKHSERETNLRITGGSLPRWCCEGPVCQLLCFLCRPRSLSTLTRYLVRLPRRLSHSFLSVRTTNRQTNATERASRTRLSRRAYGLQLHDPSLPPSSESLRHGVGSSCDEPYRPPCRPHPRARAQETGAARSGPSSARSPARERKPLSAITMHTHLLSEPPISTTSSSPGRRGSTTSRPRSLPKVPPTSGS